MNNKQELYVDKDEELSAQRRALTTWPRAIEDQLKDKDIMGVVTKAASTFSSTLSHDEIQTCILNAMWKATSKYKQDGRCKFTTYLYRGVVMECLTQQKFNLNHYTPHTTHHNIPDQKDPYSRIDLLDEINTKCEDPDLVYDRFYKNMTIKELAKQRGVCGETIRIKLKKNLKNLRNSIA